jgi:hypothetical protein
MAVKFVLHRLLEQAQMAERAKLFDEKQEVANKKMIEKLATAMDV